LAGLAARGRARTTTARPDGCLDFASNDYLGLSAHPALADAARQALDAGAPAGAGASRLLGGTHDHHAALEAEAAAFFGAEAALFCGSGYTAGLALAAALPARGDAVITDAAIHACMRDGVRLSHARAYRAAHSDPGAFDDAARRARARGAQDVWMLVEGVYSMDGDAAPLGDLAAVARRHGAWLIVDEAHATGVAGPTGRGAAQGLGYEGLVTLHTCGKALGAAGALICGPRAVVQTLVNTARSFIYTTAPPPVLAAVVRRALEVVDAEPWRRAHLRALVAAAGAAGLPARGHIIPVVLGAEGAAMDAARALEAQGFAVAAARPPTVPEGTARLRISLSAARSVAEVQALAEAVRAAYAPIAARSTP
jgi:8-amino-7-oxononanoate synthase